MKYLYYVKGLNKNTFTEITKYKELVKRKKDLFLLHTITQEIIYYIFIQK